MKSGDKAVNILHKIQCALPDHSANTCGAMSKSTNGSVDVIILLYTASETASRTPFPVWSSQFPLSSVQEGKNRRDARATRIVCGLKQINCEESLRPCLRQWNLRKTLQTLKTNSLNSAYKEDFLHLTSRLYN